MKTNKLLVAGLFLFQAAAFAQAPKLSKDFNVTVGAPYKVVDAYNKDYFSDYNGHAVMVCFPWPFEL